MSVGIVSADFSESGKRAARVYTEAFRYALWLGYCESAAVAIARNARRNWEWDETPAEAARRLVPDLEETFGAIA